MAKEHMRQQGLKRAVERFTKAEEAAKKICSLPSSMVGFGELWYDFLVSYNSAFSQIEQASKDTGLSKIWFDQVKKRRKNDALLSYLHHARNCEEHNDIGTFFPVEQLLLKPNHKIGSAYKSSKPGSPNAALTIPLGKPRLEQQ